MLEEGITNQYALLVDPQTGKEFNLCRFATSIGRSVSCDVTVLDRSISRQHAIIYCVKGKFFIEDVGSTNGTTVNKKPVTTRIPLSSGDEIRIGITPLLFLLIPDRNNLSGIYIDDTPTHDRRDGAVQVRARLTSV